MGRAVGPTGSVLAWEPANFVNDRSRAGLAALHERTPNVAVMVAPGDAFTLPAGAFDFAMINLNYHDTYWQSARFHFPRMDPAAFLRTVFESLKPGGTIVVVDHVANPGGDTRAVVEALPRIDPATIRHDFEAAGFVFAGESNILRNPADDHTKLVFDPSIRGNTDRVVYRFRRPAAVGAVPRIRPSRPGRRSTPSRSRRRPAQREDAKAARALMERGVGEPGDDVGPLDRRLRQLSLQI